LFRGEGGICDANNLTIKEELTAILYQGMPCGTKKEREDWPKCCLRSNLQNLRKIYETF
jgi:hypothetical protein